MFNSTSNVKLYASLGASITLINDRLIPAFSASSFCDSPFIFRHVEIIIPNSFSCFSFFSVISVPIFTPSLFFLQFQFCRLSTCNAAYKCIHFLRPSYTHVRHLEIFWDGENRRCMFCGHRKVWEATIEVAALAKEEIQKLASNGVNEFWTGGMGEFDHIANISYWSFENRKTSNSNSFYLISHRRPINTKIFTA